MTTAIPHWFPGHMAAAHWTTTGDSIPIRECLDSTTGKSFQANSTSIALHDSDGVEVRFVLPGWMDPPGLLRQAWPKTAESERGLAQLTDR